MEISNVSTDRWPHVISGVGMLLGLILIGEGIVVLIRPGSAPRGFSAGVVTSLPFIGGLIYGGYWVANSELSPDRYDHVGRWWAAVLIGFVLLIVPLTFIMQLMTPIRFVGTVRWSAAIGGGVGLLIGVFHARAIQRAVEAERIRHRQQETQQERDRLEQFASIVSHDLRNPLTVANGHLDLLREECDSPHIDKISSAHDRMSAIIEDTLSLARAGQTIDDTTPVDLSDLAIACWSRVESADATIQTDGTATIDADRDRLQHLFENLYRNAIEHGGDDVTIRVGTLEDTAGFYIEDDGPGIPESEREKVFESGYSGSSGGTGLGLNIVKTIVEAHGWEISVTDGDDGGTRFEIAGIE